MSHVAGKTDIHTIRAAARAVRALDRVWSPAPHGNAITAEDDLLWTQARHNLLTIIQTAGYEADPNTYQVKRVNSGYPDYKDIRR